MNKESIIITCGDPAGCGPRITLEAIKKYINEKINFWLVGDEVIFKKLPLYQKIKNKINFVNLGTPGINSIKDGFPSKLTGHASLSYLNKALLLMKKKKIKRLVTAPLSKEAAKLTSGGFTGHTEYLADYFKINNFAMMLVSQKLKVVLLTRHILLKEVEVAFKTKDIVNCLSLVYSSLRRQFGIKNPKIAFASLNPHAGVNTFLEKGEKKIINAIIKSKKKVYGPYPSDTIFVKENLKKYDCVICAYHDQAMVPFKLLSLKQGVNVTLGLPIVRTSPSHGIAADIMRKGGRPFSSSMAEAIRLALKLSP